MARTRASLSGVAGSTSTLTVPMRPSSTLISTTPSVISCTGSTAWARV